MTPSEIWGEAELVVCVAGDITTPFESFFIRVKGKTRAKTTPRREIWDQSLLFNPVRHLLRDPIQFLRPESNDHVACDYVTETLMFHVRKRGRGLKKSKGDFNSVASLHRRGVADVDQV